MRICENFSCVYTYTKRRLQDNNWTNGFSRVFALAKRDIVFILYLVLTSAAAG